MTELLYLIAFEFYLFTIYLASWYFLTGWWEKPTILGGIIQSVFLLLSISIYLLNRFSPKPSSQRINQIGALAKINFVGFSILILFLGLFFEKQPVIAQVFDHWTEIVFIWLILLQLSFGRIIINHPITQRIGEKALDFLDKYGLILLFLGLTSVKIWFLPGKIHNFVVLDDTYTYWQMAKHLLTGDFAITEFNHYPPLYPIALIPALWFDPIKIYQHTTILNSIYSSTVIFPLYLLARQFLSKRTSLLFVFTSAFYVYHLIYPGLMMSENISLPLFLWAVFFAYSKPPIQRIWVWDILLGISVGLFWLSRYLALPLVPVFLIIRYFREKESVSLENLLPTWKLVKGLLIATGFILIFEVIWLLPGLVNGVALRDLFGFQIASNPKNLTYGFDTILFWTGISLSYFVLMYIPVIPGIIQFLLSGQYFRKQLNLWNIAITLFSLVFLITVTRHAIRAGYNTTEPIKYVGRYVLYLTPLLWLSAIKSISLLTVKKKPLWISLILTLAIFGLAYFNLFHPGSFILGDLHPFLSTDMVIPWMLNGLFIFQVCCFFVILSLSSFHTSKVFSVLTVCSFLIISNLSAFSPIHKYTQSIQRMGYLLDALIQHVVNRPESATYFEAENSIKYFVTDDLNNFPKELEIRNLSDSVQSIEQIKKDPLMRYNCKTRLLVTGNNKDSFAVIDDSIQCNTQTFSKVANFTVLGDPFLLIQITQAR